MNLVIRLLIALSVAFTKPKTGIWGATLCKISTLPHDYSANRTLRTDRIFSYADIAILDYLIKSGILRTLRAHGWMPIVVRKCFKKIDAISPRKPITVITALEGWSGHYSIVSHTFYQNDTKCAFGYTIGRFVSLSGKQHPTVTNVADLMSEDTTPSTRYPAHYGAIIEELDETRKRLKPPAPHSNVPNDK